jgi:hypothetical protein
MSVISKPSGNGMETDATPPTDQWEKQWDADATFAPRAAGCTASYRGRRDHKKIRGMLKSKRLQ